MRGWLAGCGAATGVICGFALVIVAIAPGDNVSARLAGGIVVLLFASIIVFATTCVLTGPPAAVIIGLSEKFQIRSILFFGGAGAVTGGVSQAPQHQLARLSNSAGANGERVDLDFAALGAEDGITQPPQALGIVVQVAVVGALAAKARHVVAEQQVVGFVAVRHVVAGAGLRGLIPVVSRDSALAEAVNGAAIPVNPHSVSEIGEAMESVLALDEDKRNALRNTLMAHAQGATRERFLTEWNDLISAELQ